MLFAKIAECVEPEILELSVLAVNEIVNQIRRRSYWKTKSVNLDDIINWNTLDVEWMIHPHNVSKRCLFIVYVKGQWPCYQCV